MCQTKQKSRKCIGLQVHRILVYSFINVDLEHEAEEMSMGLSFINGGSFSHGSLERCRLMSINQI